MRAGRVISSVVLAIFGVVILLGIIGLFGGPQAVWLRLKPAPNPADLADERKNAFSVLGEENGRAAAGTPLKKFAEGRHDQCRRGQNDWKVNEGFAHRCVAKLTRFYGFNGDFRQLLIDMDRGLATQGWVNEYQTVEQMLIEYYDPSYHKPNRRTGEIQLVSNLPKPSYRKNSGILKIRFAERLTKPPDVETVGSVQQIVGAAGNPEFEKQDLVDVGQVFGQITKDHEFMIVVAIERAYFSS